MIIRKGKWSVKPGQLVILLTLCLLSPQILAQFTFQRHYGPTLGDYGQSVVQAADGGFYVAATAGVEIDGITYNQAALLRTDPLGDTLYYKHFAPNVTGCFIENITKGSDGNLVAAGLVDYGVIDGFSDYNAYVVKIDTEGELLWSTSIGGPFKEWAYQVRETPEGGFVVAGWRNAIGLVNHGACYLIRLNDAGDTLWTRTYPNPGPWDQLAYCVAVLPDLGYVLGGIQYYGGTGRPFVLRTNAQGDTLWTRTLNELGGGEVRDVETLANSHIIIAGYSFPGGGYAKPVLLELDENGDLLWYRNYQHAGAGLAEWCFSMCKTSTGYALLNMDSNYNAFWLTNVDPAGDTLWTKGFTVNGGYAYSVEQTSDGGFVMTGTTQMEDTQIVLIKTDDSGNVVTSTNDIALDPSIGATLFPNPVAGTSTFQYSTAVSGSFSLVLHDGGGRVVRTIFTNGRRAPGQYEEHIDLSSLASGTYTLVLSNGPRAVSVKAMKL